MNDIGATEGPSPLTGDETMNAIIRHNGDGMCYAATIEDGQVTAMSAPLAVADTFGRDFSVAEITGEQWEDLGGYADLEAFEDEASQEGWNRAGYTVIHTF